MKKRILTLGIATISLSLLGISECRAQAPANDDAAGAINLTVVGTGTLPTFTIGTGSDYTNDNATASTSEPFPNCDGTSGHHTVWFKFTPTASSGGTLAITTDYSTPGTLLNTKIALFSATDSTDYSTFTLIACDDDNGVNNGTNDSLSTLYVTGLTEDETYYIEVDGHSANDTGSFGIQVGFVTPGTILFSDTTCAEIQTPTGDNNNYTGWVSLVDNAGNLVALIQDTAGAAPSDYGGSYTIVNVGPPTNMPRQDNNGIYYLSRNYYLEHANNDPLNVLLFFSPGDLAAFTGTTGATIGNFNVSQQSGSSCEANFNQANGPATLLSQTENGTTFTNVSWIGIQTADLSNLYITGGTTPLAIGLENIAAENQGLANQVTWSINTENNFRSYELQRSMDGKSFKTIALLESRNGQERYSYIDNSPLKGMNYYRLKILETGGNYVYSSVVTATIQTNHPLYLTAYPNPVRQTLTLSPVTGGLMSQGATVTISDITGMIRSTITLKEESATTIDMQNFPAGIYFVNYSDALHNQVIKVTKQ